MFHISRSVRGFNCLVWAVVSLGLAVPADAAPECGSRTPDYTAQRKLIIGHEVTLSKVYVSGSKLREEGDGSNGKPPVVLRLPERGVSYLLDPVRKEALMLPLPPRPEPSKQQTRQTVDDRADGTIMRHLQLLSGGEWHDISTTICRADGVMVEQSFELIDPKGHPLSGHLTQTAINVGPLPGSLFEIPPSVDVKDSASHPAKPLDR